MMSTNELTWENIFDKEFSPTLCPVLKQCACTLENMLEKKYAHLLEPILPKMMGTRCDDKINWRNEHVILNVKKRILIPIYAEYTRIEFILALHDARSYERMSSACSTLRENVNDLIILRSLESMSASVDRALKDGNERYTAAACALGAVCYAIKALNNSVYLARVDPDPFAQMAVGILVEAIELDYEQNN